MSDPSSPWSRSLPPLRTLLLLSMLGAAGACAADEGPAPDADAASAAASDAAVPADGATGAEAPEPSPRTLERGVDVSVHSGEVDLSQVVEAGYDFVVLKATEGVDLADPAFEEHWRRAGELGLVRGAYHFYVTEDDPLEQARFFISRAPLGPGDLAPVVDIEVLGHGTGPGLPDRLRTFVGELERHYGVRPIIYTSPNFWDQHLGGGFGEHPLWVAEYGVDEPRLPAGWEGWTLWQYEDDSVFPGVEKDADLSRVHPDHDPSRLLVPRKD